MQVIHGRIQRFLRGSGGELNGLILDRGIEVQIPSAKSNQVLAIAEIGSTMEMHGWVRPGPAGGMQFHATAIINDDSKQFVYLHELPHNPEMPFPSTPTSEEAASLGPLPADQQGRGITAQAHESIEDSSEPEKRRPFFHESQAASEPGSQRTEAATSILLGNRENAVREIERAYDGLHHAQALLAYLKIVDLESPNVGQLFDGAKLSYERALSSHRKQKFSEASELAAASSGLSLAVETVISRAFRASANSPTLVPPPPLHPATSGGSAQIHDRLLHVQRLLSRIHWLLENGTMPAEEIQEVQKITSWSESFLRQAQREFRTVGAESSADLANTAYEIAQAAEHICKKCYVTREDAPHFTVTAQPSD